MKEPIAGAIRAAQAAMTAADWVEVEDVLQRWGLWGPEDSHIYARAGTRYQILARKVPDTGRYLVAVYDLGAPVPKIVAVAVEKGDIRKVVQPAFLYLGMGSRSVQLNRRWTG